MPKTCKSGLKGWRSRLQKQYQSFAEFEHYDLYYGLAARLGYDTAQEAWDANPMVRGSVNPEDYRRD